MPQPQREVFLCKAVPSRSKLDPWGSWGGALHGTGPKGVQRTAPACLARPWLCPNTPCTTLALHCPTGLPCTLAAQSHPASLLSQRAAVPQPDWAAARYICPKSPSSERLQALPLCSPLSEQAWLGQAKPILPALLSTALQRHISH